MVSRCVKTSNRSPTLSKQEIYLLTTEMPKGLRQRCLRGKGGSEITHFAENSKKKKSFKTWKYVEDIDLKWLIFWNHKLALLQACNPLHTVLMVWKPSHWEYNPKTLESQKNELVSQISEGFTIKSLRKMHSSWTKVPNAKETGHHKQETKRSNRRNPLTSTSDNGIITDRLQIKLHLPHSKTI